MGQRHQIYVRLADKSVIGIHHQWLWGITAVCRLANYLNFTMTADEPLNKTEALDRLALCYSIDMQTGYYHDVHKLDDEETINPEKTDNNNGITLIDLSGKTPKYCFMSLHHLECLDKSIAEQCEQGEEPFKNMQPMDVDKWISLHYSKKDFNKFQGTDKPSYKKALKIVKTFKVMSHKDCQKMFPKIEGSFIK
jgi:hypothetical protein